MYTPWNAPPDYFPWDRHDDDPPEPECEDCGYPISQCRCDELEPPEEEPWDPEHYVRDRVMTLECTECHEPVEPGRKYIVVFATKDGGFRLVIGCEHIPKNPFGSIGVVASSDCLAKLIHEYIRACKHPI